MSLTYERWEKVMYGAVLLIGALLIAVGVLGAGQTHLAPDCPGPALSCFMDVNATLSAQERP